MAESQIAPEYGIMSDQFQEFSGCFYLCSEAVTTLAAAGWAAKLLLRSGSLGCNGISESRRTPEQQAAAGADTTRGASLVNGRAGAWPPGTPRTGRPGAGEGLVAISGCADTNRGIQQWWRGGIYSPLPSLD